MGCIYFLACLHRISSTVIAHDLVSEFGAHATALGIMSSAYFYLYSAVQPPVGILSDTLGSRRVVTVFSFIACGGALIFGAASSMTMATIGRALIGIGVGGVFVPALKSFSKWYRAREFAAITGLFLATGNAGNLAASLPLTYLVLLVGWRMSFLTIAAASLLLGILSWAILRDSPEEKGWQPLETYENPEIVAAEDTPEDITTFKRLGIVFKSSSFWLVTISTFFYGGPALTFQGLWAVPYLMDVHEYSRMEAGGLLMMVPLGFVMGAPSFGFFADRLALNRKSVLLFCLGFGTCCWAIFTLSGERLPTFPLGALFLVMGSCGGGSLSLYMTMLKELFPPWLTGTAVGLMNPAAFLSAAVFQPFSGFLMDAVGPSGAAYPLEAYHRVFIFFLSSMVISVACILPLSIQKVRSPGTP
jgi:sugar phosphate permease